jgi:hypothetical protein
METRSMFGAKIFPSGGKPNETASQAEAERADSGTPDSPVLLSGTTDDQLFRAMDQAAVSFLKILENTDIIINADGTESPRYSLQERMKAFAMVESWLARRHKLKPADDENDAPGIEMMKRVIREQMIEMNVVTSAPRKRGRPRLEEKQKMLTEESKARAKALVAPEEDQDDSGLQQLLNGVRAQ